MRDIICEWQQFPWGVLVYIGLISRPLINQVWVGEYGLSRPMAQITPKFTFVKQFGIAIFRLLDFSRILIFRNKSRYLTLRPVVSPDFSNYPFFFTTKSFFPWRFDKSGFHVNELSVLTNIYWQKPIILLAGALILLPLTPDFVKCYFFMF